MLELSEVMLFICIFLFSAYTLMLFKNIRKRYPPGPWGLPLVGHIALMGTHPQYKFQTWRRKYGDVFCIRMGAWRTVVINGYSVIKEAMERKGNPFSDRPKCLSAGLLKKAYQGSDSVSFGPFNQSNMELRKLSLRALHRYTHSKCTHTQEIVHEEVEILLDEILSGTVKIPVCVPQIYVYDRRQGMFEFHLHATSLRNVTAHKNCCHTQNAQDKLLTHI